MPSISSSPEPLPHGESGKIQFSASTSPVHAEVSLKLASGNIVSRSFHRLSEGDTSFKFAADPTWDGSGGGVIMLRLYSEHNGKQKDLAYGSGTYLA